MAFPTQTKHVFSVLTFTGIANTGLTGEERLKTFPLQAFK
ncbi:hypothetical protein BN130_2413 [Cronobacter malonaticus 507]|nr:hypothetical protein BN130_2413 [Cronobacter malonaticus 507]